MKVVVLAGMFAAAGRLGLVAGAQPSASCGAKDYAALRSQRAISGSAPTHEKRSDR